MSTRYDDQPTSGHDEPAPRYQHGHENEHGHGGSARPPEVIDQDPWGDPGTAPRWGTRATGRGGPGQRPAAAQTSPERPRPDRSPGAGPGELVCRDRDGDGDAGERSGSGERAWPGDPAGGRPAAGLHERARAVVVAAVSEIRWVSEQPASLRDHIRYARLGQWTAQIDGRARHLHLLWAWAIAIPVSVAAYLTVWSVSRGPARALAVWGVVAVLATVLNQIPGIELLVPDWASLTTWPPFTWL